MTIAIPGQESEFTPDWLTNALGCDRKEIKTIHARSLVNSVGLTSQVYFLDVATTPGSLIPSKLVAKVSSHFETTAEVMRSYQVFSRETYFYNDIAPHLPVRTPRCFFGWADPVTEAGILILEDCSHYESRDPAAPMPTSEAELLASIDVLARVAAGSRSAGWLDHPLMFRPGGAAWSRYFSDVQRDWGNLTRRDDLMRYLAPGFDQLAYRLADCIHPLIDGAWPRRDLSLIHIDYHPGNWFLDSSRPDDPLIVYDWQGCGAGPPIVDLTHLLSAFYPPEYRRSIEDRAISRFLVTLQSLGTTDYDEGVARADYELGLLLSMRLPPMFVSMFDPSNAHTARSASKILYNLSTAATDRGGHAWLDRLEARARN